MILILSCLQIIPGCHLSPARWNCNSGGNLAKPNQQIFSLGNYYQALLGKCQTAKQGCPCAKTCQVSRNKPVLLKFSKISQTTMSDINLIQKCFAFNKHLYLFMPFFVCLLLFFCLVFAVLILSTAESWTSQCDGNPESGWSSSGHKEKQDPIEIRGGEDISPMSLTT